MDPEFSLPCSQQPPTDPYPKSDPFSPPYFPNIHYNIIVSSMPRSSKFSLSFMLCGFLSRGHSASEIAGGGDGLQVRRVAVNILNKQ
jgi:hypothetical protein